jgi:hypothetical protein
MGVDTFVSLRTHFSDLPLFTQVYETPLVSCAIPTLAHLPPLDAADVKLAPKTKTIARQQAMAPTIFLRRITSQNLQQIQNEPTTLLLWVRS